MSAIIYFCCINNTQKEDLVLNSADVMATLRDSRLIWVTRTTILSYHKKWSD